MINTRPLAVVYKSPAWFSVGMAIACARDLPQRLKNAIDIVPRSRDGISARRVGRHSDGFPIWKLKPGPMMHEYHAGAVGFSLRPLSAK